MKGTVEEALSILLVVSTSLVVLSFSWSVGDSYLAICREQNKVMMFRRLSNLLAEMPRDTCVVLPSCVPEELLNLSAEYTFSGGYLCRK